MDPEFRPRPLMRRPGRETGDGPLQALPAGVDIVTRRDRKPGDNEVPLEERDRDPTAGLVRYPVDAAPVCGRPMGEDAAQVLQARRPQHEELELPEPPRRM